MRSDAINYGRNAEHARYRDDRYVRCSRCGFLCNTDRDLKASEGSHAGWGINQAEQGVDYDDGSFYDLDNKRYDFILYDPVVTSGCPQCGTLLYNK